jgi:RNA polymerase-associated protein LEO1
MANEDLIKDVFGGSDSDSDSEGGDAGTKADAPKRGAALEDSDDDAPAEAKGEDGAPDAQPKFRSSLEDPEQADGDSDDDEDERANVPAAAPPMTIEKALHDPLVSTTIPKLVKLTNIAGVESRPFDASSFEPTEDHHLKNHNVMRWRRNKDTGKIESNARFVKWSDGTTQLVIGDETLAVSEATVNKDHAYVFARHAGAMQARAHVHSKLVFRPATLDSETHRRLTRAVDKKHVKSAQTRMHIEVQDPEAAKDAADREALRLEKDAELLRKKRAAAMRGGGTVAAPEMGRPRASRRATRSTLTAAPGWTGTSSKPTTTTTTTTTTRRARRRRRRRSSSGARRGGTTTRRRSRRKTPRPRRRRGGAGRSRATRRSDACRFSIIL